MRWILGLPGLPGRSTIQAMQQVAVMGTKSGKRRQKNKNFGRR